MNFLSDKQRTFLIKLKGAMHDRYNKLMILEGGNESLSHEDLLKCVKYVKRIIDNGYYTNSERKRLKSISETYHFLIGTSK